MAPRDTPSAAATAEAERLKQRMRFLADIEPFNGLSKLELERVARSIVERVAEAGEAVLVESGVPGTELYVVLRRHARAGPQRGRRRPDHARRGLRPPEAAHRPAARVHDARQQQGGALLHPQRRGLRPAQPPRRAMWLAGNQRERLIQATRAMRSLPDVRNRPVTSLVRSAPLFCEPDTPIREAARHDVRSQAQRHAGAPARRSGDRHRRRLSRQGRAPGHIARRAGHQDHDLAACTPSAPRYWRPRRASP